MWMYVMGSKLLQSLGQFFITQRDIWAIATYSNVWSDEQYLACKGTRGAEQWALLQSYSISRCHFQPLISVSSGCSTWNCLDMATLFALTSPIIFPKAVLEVTKWSWKSHDAYICHWPLWFNLNCFLWLVMRLPRIERPLMAPGHPFLSSLE